MVGRIMESLEPWAVDIRERRGRTFGECCLGTAKPDLL